ncbi:MAG: ABC transporter ATP-binding protein [Lysobacterales bacterium CG17_big_fil_post_rev_8_21_14_2_50_64_11]|nr:MAG: ABC transporter ATP-binding protein [Xanthomonadales bacterium CG17_big_fil_post_rev_8_21_14_2_50_64_11]
MIQTTALSKRYGEHLVVDRVSFSVQPGEVLGFLGPNGAGKSTTMKMIAGFIGPSDGTATVCGHDVQTQTLAARRVLGYLPEGAPSYAEMTVLAFLRFIADSRALTGNHRRQRLDYVVGRLSLQSVLQQTIDTLSKGFRRRVGLAAAILHDPPVLVLDEPTDGLDPNQKHEVRGLIREMSPDRTILISTHILEEVPSVCTRAIIIADGRIMADATPAELLARSRYTGALSVRAADSVAARSALEGLAGVAGVENDPVDGRMIVLAVPGHDLFTAVAERLRERGVAFAQLQVEPARLEDVFRSITQPTLVSP